MKIKTKNKSYSEVLELQGKGKVKLTRQPLLFRILLLILSLPALISTKFKCEKVGMDKLGKKEPCFILMNHSSFTDMKIACKILFPRRFNIVTSMDAFIGKNWLMRQIGCIPTTKFALDIGLVKNISRAIKKNKCSVLMYPEAGYTFDGTKTTLPPDSLGKFAKMLGVPLVMITTYGAYARDPMYNGLQIRKVNVSAKMEYLLSPDEIKEMSADEINRVIEKSFSFDNFRWQQENKIAIRENFRADGLNRVLYKCPHCLAECGNMEGKGTEIICHSCGAKYELDEYGYLKGINCETKFNHVPDWYKWERECVRQEIADGQYSMSDEVDIYALVDTKCLYRVGEGTLTHNSEGFTLKGCDGELEYRHTPQTSYSLMSDFLWYEIGDVIAIGTKNIQYHCFPKNKKDVVAKARLATEEMYTLYRESKAKK